MIPFVPYRISLSLSFRNRDQRYTVVRGVKRRPPLSMSTRKPANWLPRKAKHNKRRKLVRKVGRQTVMRWLGKKMWDFTQRKFKQDGFARKVLKQTQT